MNPSTCSPHDGVDFREVLFSVEYMNQAKCKNGDHMDAEGTQEHKKIAVVAATYTVVHPWAVMVECLERNHL